MAHLRTLPAPDDQHQTVGGHTHTDTGYSLTHEPCLHQYTLKVHGRCLALFSPRAFVVLSPSGEILAQRHGALSSHDWSDFHALVRHHLGIPLPSRPGLTH